VAAGASPTGGVGGIFYFLLLVVGLIHRSYRRVKKGIGLMRYVPIGVLGFSLALVAAINIVFVYGFVKFHPTTLGGSVTNLGVGVQLQWQLSTALFFGVVLLAMFAIGFVLLSSPGRTLRYRLGCLLMIGISLMLLLWLPLGILDSLHILNFPF
jgi:hypothetical protein